MQRQQHARHHGMPIAVTITAIALFSVMDALMKRASIAGGVYSALLVRSLLGWVITGTVWRLRGGRIPTGKLLRLHALRGLVGCVTASTFFYGLVRTPMAVGMALSFMAPLFALYLAAATLGETIRPAAIKGSLVGFSGVIVIAAERMGGMEMQGAAVEGIIAIFISAATYGWNLVLQRKQAQLASPGEVAVFQNLFFAVFMLPLAPWLWSVPPTGEWGDIAAAALLATLSLMLLAWAYARAEAQTLLPFEYTAFVWAAVMGWLWFDEVPTPGALVGVVLIVGGCWIATRSPAQTPPG